MTPHLGLLALTVAMAAAGLTEAGAAGNAPRSQYEPSPLEVAQLPKYCQGQFRPELKSKPGYTISGCGWFNHFCPGLVLLNRASDISLPKRDRVFALSHAPGELAYTRKHMTPNCPLAPDLQAAEMRLRFLQMTVK